jgi:tRNA (cmo5U34)-methyltransferase
MLMRSIPAYHDMRGLVVDLGQQFVRAGTDIIDLGCSRGAGLAPFVDLFGSQVRCVALDESEPMVSACRQRFRHEVKAGTVDVRLHDLRRGLPPLSPTLTLGVLTLQFIPLEHRQRVIADVFRITRPGGAFIVVEKTLGDDAAMQSLFVQRYHARKRQNGYTQEQVDAKADSLQGVLVPLTPEGNESMLRAEGWRVARFWQSLAFMAWVCVKPEGK